MKAQAIESATALCTNTSLKRQPLSKAWPTLEAFQADLSWHSYLQRVYGDIAELHFPFSLDRLAFFYASQLPADEPRDTLTSSLVARAAAKRLGLRSCLRNRSKTCAPIVRGTGGSAIESCAAPPSSPPHPSPDSHSFGVSS